MIRRFISCAIVLVIFIGLQYAHRQWLGALPELKPPVPQLPSPNAYDYYIKASDALIAAPSKIDPVFDRERIPEAQWKTHYPLAKKQAWLKQNAATLRFIREGFAHTSRVPSRRKGQDLMEQDTLRENLRSMARMLIVESRVYSEQRQWDAAAASALDCSRMGYDLMQGGNIFDYLVGASVNVIGMHELWDILPHLDAQQTQRAALRLEKLESMQVSARGVMEEEKYSGQARIVKTMQELSIPYTFHSDESSSLSFRSIFKTLTTTRRAVLNNYTHYMDQLILHSANSYSATSPLPKAPTDMYSQIHAPSYQNFRWNFARVTCKASQLRVALLLHVYQLEKGAYPQNLNELTPHYLKEIPQDPFSSGGTLKYKKTQEKYILYSIGPDGKDDGGRAIEDKEAKNKRRRFFAQPESKGDFVAGVNN